MSGLPMLSLSAQDVESLLELAPAMASQRSGATPEEAVRGIRIVATCTLSRAPVVRGVRLTEGCTVISIGSVEPDRREVDLDVLRRAESVVVDHPGTAAGPVVAALRDGLVSAAARTAGR
ncbi:MAG TPA: hypothetical protein VFV67_23735 [Actinophytocola sp.]|uniref:hypothetical protein n=1 Tax=Actinophytocola sp. TaxID=1872138 RepID=UPI002DBEDF14|nr:hypothetical protein [Actinophytocola sp.]HEU5473669.1 hypothetical protein [Actinophytocola sp.]